MDRNETGLVDVPANQLPETLEVIPSTAFPVLQDGMIGTCVEVANMTDKIFCWFASPEFTMKILQLFGGA